MRAAKPAANIPGVRVDPLVVSAGHGALHADFRVGPVRNQRVNGGQITTVGPVQSGREPEVPGDDDASGDIRVQQRGFVVEQPCGAQALSLTRGLKPEAGWEVTDRDISPLPSSNQVAASIHG
jgi:hypothetical protein